MWIAAQSTFIQFFNPQQLRDFGVGVINGSLWTIPVELQFYIFLPIVILISRKLWSTQSSKSVFYFLMTTSAVSFALKIALASKIDSESLTAKLLAATLAPHLFQFVLGFMCLPLLLLLGRRRSIFTLVFLGCVALVLSSSGFDVFGLLKAFSFAALPIGIGLIPFDILRGIDISYGLYLFHMPVMNSLIMLDLGKDFVVINYLILTLVMALVSWFLVEKPFLRLKGRFLSI